MSSLKQKLKKGGGELIAFMGILPCLCFLLIFIVGAFQNGAIKERLEYTTYMACRAAISERKFEDAQNAARQAAEEDFNKAKDKHLSNMKVELKIIGEPDKEDSNTWTKGNMVQCTLKVDVNKTPIFFPKKRAFSIVMMIENPAGEEDGENTYRWFRDYQKKHGG